MKQDVKNNNNFLLNETSQGANLPKLEISNDF